VSRSRHTFRQADVVRLIKAARATWEGIQPVVTARASGRTPEKAMLDKSQTSSQRAYRVGKRV
jgi:hypothetical protein